MSKSLIDRFNAGGLCYARLCYARLDASAEALTTANLMSGPHPLLH